MNILYASKIFTVSLKHFFLNQNISSNVKTAPTKRLYNAAYTCTMIIIIMRSFFRNIFSIIFWLFWKLINVPVGIKFFWILDFFFITQRFTPKMKLSRDLFFQNISWVFVFFHFCCFMVTLFNQVLSFE